MAAAQLKIVSTKKAVKDILKRSDDYRTDDEETTAKAQMLFRGLTAHLAEDINMLTPRERIEFSIKLLPHFTKFREAGQEMAQRDAELQKTVDLFKEEEEK